MADNYNYCGLMIADCRLQIDGIGDWALMIGGPITKIGGPITAIVDQQSSMASIANLQSAICNS
jgi:hypothetical protein